MTGAVIARCSQPEVGWLGWRSSEDEDLIKAISDACTHDPGIGAQSSTGSEDETDGDTSSVSNGETHSLKDLSQECFIHSKPKVTSHKRQVMAQ